MKDLKSKKANLDFADQLNIVTKNDFINNSDEFVKNRTLDYDEDCYLERVAEEECDRQADGYYIEPVSFFNH